MSWKEACDIFKPEPTPGRNGEGGGTPSGRWRWTAAVPWMAVSSMAFVLAFVALLLSMSKGRLPSADFGGEGTLPAAVEERLAVFDAAATRLDLVETKLLGFERGLAAAGPNTVRKDGRWEKAVQRLEASSGRLAELENKLTAMEQSLAGKQAASPPDGSVLKAVEGKLSDLEQKLVEVETAERRSSSGLAQRIGRLEAGFKRLETVEGKLPGLEKKLEQVNQTERRDSSGLAQRIDRLEAGSGRLKTVEGRLSGLEKKLSKVDQAERRDSSGLAQRIDRLEAGAERLKTAEGQLTGLEMKLTGLEKAASRNVLLERRMEAASKRLESLEGKLATFEKTPRGTGDAARESRLAGRVERLEASLSKVSDQVDQKLEQVRKQVAALGKDSPPKRTLPKALVHRVRAGETLYMIARRYDVTVGQLRRHNDLKSKAVIYPGQKLIIRPAGR